MYFASMFCLYLITFILPVSVNSAFRDKNKTKIIEAKRKTLWKLESSTIRFCCNTYFILLIPLQKLLFTNKTYSLHSNAFSVPFWSSFLNPLYFLNWCHTFEDQSWEYKFIFPCNEFSSDLCLIINAICYILFR